MAKALRSPLGAPEPPPAIAAKAATFDEFKQITRFNEWVALEDRFGR